MKLNSQLKKEIEKYKNYVFIVEGKKDVLALNSRGFSKVYSLHVTGVSLRERLEQIVAEINRKEKVCILTDLDKKGKQLYLRSKTILQELGARLDSSLRGLLIKARVSHVEGIDKFLGNTE